MQTVGDIMATELVTFTPETNIHDAIRILLDRRYSGAPVVDGSGGLVGVLSKKDCLRITFSTSYYEDRGGPVSDFMSTPAETLDADMDLVAAAELFLGSHFRRFPVLRAGRLVGQVSRHDILRALIAAG